MLRCIPPDFRAWALPNQQLLPTNYSRSSYQYDRISSPSPSLVFIFVASLQTSSSSLIIFAHHLHCSASSSALVFLRRSSSSIARLHHFFVRAFQVLIIPAFHFVYSCFLELFLGRRVVDKEDALFILLATESRHTRKTQPNRVT